MEKIGNPWCFWGCHLQTFDHLLWPSLFLVLLVLTPDFENEVTLMVDWDGRSSVRWTSAIPCKHFIYNSLVLSDLNYGILLWGFKYDKVFKLQKRIIRISNLGKYNVNTEPIFKRLKLLKIRDILKLQE